MWFLTLFWGGEWGRPFGFQHKLTKTDTLEEKHMTMCFAHSILFMQPQRICLKDVLSERDQLRTEASGPKYQTPNQIKTNICVQMWPKACVEKNVRAVRLLPGAAGCWRQQQTSASLRCNHTRCRESLQSSGAHRTCNRRLSILVYYTRAYFSQFHSATQPLDRFFPPFEVHLSHGPKVFWVPFLMGTRLSSCGHCSRDFRAITRAAMGSLGLLVMRQLLL